VDMAYFVLLQVATRRHSGLKLTMLRPYNPTFTPGCSGRDSLIAGEFYL
jgi:hypothetical protein